MSVLSLFQFSPLKSTYYSGNSPSLNRDVYSSVKQPSPEIPTVIPVPSALKPMGPLPSLNAGHPLPEVSLPTISSASSYYSPSSMGSSVYTNTSGYNTPTPYPVQSTYRPTDSNYYQSSFNNSFSSPSQSQVLPSPYVPPVEVQQPYSSSVYPQSVSRFNPLPAPNMMGMGIQPVIKSADMMKQEFKNTIVFDAIPDYDYLEFGKTDTEHSCKALSLYCVCLNATRTKTNYSFFLFFVTESTNFAIFFVFTNIGFVTSIL